MKMIRATMYWNRLRLEAAGHAGYAEKGQDIVCAGASALTNALANALEEAEERGRCSMEAKNRDGYAMITADPTMGNRQEIKAYFKMAVTGMKKLQEQYPKNIEIREVM